MNENMKESNNKKALSSLLLENTLDFIEIAVVALVFVAVLFAFFIRVVAVDGASMNDTLHHEDQLIIRKAFYTPQHGDIVIINRENTMPMIKRVIAMEGDTIFIDPSTLEVYLNGEVLNEPYVHYDTLRYDMTEPVTVPENHVFVMGDHRDNSYDSRQEEVGCVPIDSIVGKAIWRFLPIESFGGIYDNLA